MSRTNHLTQRELDPRIHQTRDETRTQLDVVRPRRHAPSRLTRDLRNAFYVPAIIAAAGNHWQGTIADIGGDSRRRNTREVRADKITGRRRARRRQARDLRTQRAEATEGET